MRWLVLISLVCSLFEGVAEAESCPSKLAVTKLAPGLTLERKRPAIAPPLPGASPCLWMVRVDPKKFSLHLATATMAKARTPAEWIASSEFVAVINAAMYAPSGRPTGFTVAKGKVINGHVNRQYGAYLAFGPRKKGLPAVEMASPRCAGFDLERLRRDYHSIVQNYRLLDCDAKAVSWKDPKMHSAAAVAVDTRGRVVFVHMVTPYRMREFSRILADPELGLAAAMFVEGGTPAQMSLRRGQSVVERIGAYEALGLRRGGTPEALPNVLGFRPR